MQRDHPILFYDGECGLCDTTVQWLLKRDRNHALDFAPLQGATYAGLSITDKPNDLGTVVLLDDLGLHVRSTAVLRAARLVGGIWKSLAGLGLIVPLFLRDAVYRFIARRRLQWFGGKDSCKIPTLADRSRFLP